jgi:hypothetical protein
LLNDDVEGTREERGVQKLDELPWYWGFIR